MSALKQRYPTSAKVEASDWASLRHLVAAVNPEFAAIVDEIDPPKEFTLYQGEFSYGHKIVHQGILYLPDEQGQLRPVTDTALSSKIREDLNYNVNSNPACIVLDNSVEMFFSLEDRVIPFLTPMRAGTIFGTWRVLNPTNKTHPAFLWELTSGARSVFMLPKISEAQSHARIKRKFNIPFDKPQSYLDHWKIFAAMANHKEFSQDWNSKLVLFSRRWFENFDDPAWKKFYFYLFNKAWGSSSVWRDKFMWDFVFSYIQKERHLKPSPYISNVVKHLLAIATKGASGFVPATDDQLAPIKGLQQVYLQDYGLKQYPATIMQPALFDMYDDSALPVYTSLQVPTQLEFFLKSSERSSTITDLHVTSSLLRQYVSQLKHGDYLIEDTIYYDIFDHANFDFFHTNPDDYYEIQSSKLIPEQDERFMQALIPTTNDSFPTNNTFIRGCVKVSKKAPGEIS